MHGQQLRAQGFMQLRVHIWLPIRPVLCRYVV